MCGICGIFNLNGEPVSPVLLRKMTDAIAHRGPDGEGFFIDSFIGLGHRRLAVIALSPAAHQPMATPGSRFIISYNGEVYNFQELRVELEGLGHQFRSRSDTGQEGQRWRIRGVVTAGPLGGKNGKRMI